MPDHLPSHPVTPCPTPSQRGHNTPAGARCATTEYATFQRKPIFNRTDIPARTLLGASLVSAAMWGALAWVVL